MSEEIPTPCQIAECPELAILSVLDFTLDGCVRALVAAHPDLDQPEHRYMVGYPAQCALRLLAQIWKLKHAVSSYCFRVRQCSLDERDSRAGETCW